MKNIESKLAIILSVAFLCFVNGSANGAAAVKTSIQQCRDDIGQLNAYPKARYIFNKQFQPITVPSDAALEHGGFCHATIQFTTTPPQNDDIRACDWTPANFYTTVKCISI